MSLRIISGRYGGRTIATSDSRATHPMGDRIRGSLFNILGDLTGKTVLDAFAGSGSLGLEALSRGASQAVFIERDRLAQRVLVGNIAFLNLQNEAKLIRSSVVQWDTTQPDARFDLIFADPPYHDVQVVSIERLVRHLATGGMFILSWPGREELPLTVGHLILIDSRSYGDACLGFYRAREV